MLAHEDWAEQVTADSLQSAVTQGKRSQILTLEMVWGPDLTHTTCISPGHPKLMGNSYQSGERSWLGKEGSLFIF